SATFSGFVMFAGIKPLISELCDAAKLKAETLRTDPEIFDVWSRFVCATERLSGFQPRLPEHEADPAVEQWAAQGVQLIRAGKDLIAYITRARVPMPKSTRELIAKLVQFRSTCCIANGPERNWQQSLANVSEEPAAIPQPTSLVHH